MGDIELQDTSPDLVDENDVVTVTLADGNRVYVRGDGVVQLELRGAVTPIVTINLYLDLYGNEDDYVV